mgnify:CR=1 FL=1
MPREPYDATVATTETVPHTTCPAAFVPPLRVFAWVFCANPAEADDLVRHTLLKALADAHRFAPGRSLHPWLFRIMRHLAHAGHMNARQNETAGPAPRNGEDGRRPGQAWSLNDKELTQAIRMLPRSQREVIVLIGVLGMSDRETAEICDCDTVTVNRRLTSARSRLLDALKTRSSRRSVANSRTPVSAVGPQSAMQIQRM